jgi:acyl-CoA reductase-like NAD-dependent aldehyde dehydrogenase
MESSMKPKYINDINPATGKVIVSIKCSTKREVLQAVNNARKALPFWSQLPLKERSKRLKAIAKDFAKNKRRIGRLITDEMGKLYRSAVRETESVAYGIRETVALAKLALRAEKLNENGLTTELHRTQIGVCAVITPWNFPVGMPESLLSPAFLAGNTVVSRLVVLWCISLLFFSRLVILGYISLLLSVSAASGPHILLLPLLLQTASAV